jgi:hypothetical protein
MFYYSYEIITLWWHNHGAPPLRWKDIRQPQKLFISWQNSSVYWHPMAFSRREPVFTNKLISSLHTENLMDRTQLNDHSYCVPFLRSFLFYNNILFVCIDHTYHSMHTTRYIYLPWGCSSILYLVPMVVFLVVVLLFYDNRRNFLTKLNTYNNNDKRRTRWAGRVPSDQYSVLALPDSPSR